MKIADMTLREIEQLPLDKRIMVMRYLEKTCLSEIDFETLRGMKLAEFSLD